MSLAKISRSGLCDEKEEYSLRIHDLYLDYAQRMVGEAKAEWHQRLLNGHLSTFVCNTIDANEDSVQQMLEYSPRAWWRRDIGNKEYIRQNLCRHLRYGNLELELGAVVLDIRWMEARGFPGLKKDCGQLNSLFMKTDASFRVVHSIAKSILNVLEHSYWNMTKGLRVLSFVLLSGLCSLSETDEVMARFLDNVKTVAPKPCLVPLFRSADLTETDCNPWVM